MSEPRFEKLPVLFEGPGVDGKAPAKVDVDSMKELRRQRAAGAQAAPLSRASADEAAGDLYDPVDDGALEVAGKAGRRRGRARDAQDRHRGR